ncbi:MAG: DUF998 domain-containing protein [Erysipelotrichaceae bacterium]
MNEKKTKLIVELPEPIVEALEIEESDSATFTQQDERIVLSLDKYQHSNDVPLKWIFVPSVMVCLLFLLVNLILSQSAVALTGEFSIALFTSVLGLISGMSVFIYFFIKDRKNDKRANKKIYWRNFPAVVLSFVIILFLALLLFFKVLDMVFYGASFDVFTSTALVFMFVSIIHYLMIRFARSITPKLLTDVLILVIIGGVFAAMVTNSDAMWWQYNFSFLGTSEASSSWAFNLTLIVSGLIMIALIDYLFVLIREKHGNNKRYFILNIILVLTAICLAGVGFFPYKEGVEFYMNMHNRVAGYLVYLLIILIAGLKWFLPSISKDFLKISYLIVVGMIAAIFLFLGIGYLSLTAFELVAFMLGFSWLLLLLSNLQKLAHDGSDDYSIIIKKIK